MNRSPIKRDLKGCKIMKNPLIELLFELGRTHGDFALRRAIKVYLRKKGDSTMKTARLAIPKQWIYDAYDRQNGTCPGCGSPIHSRNFAVGDHIQPIARGGDHSPSNIRAMHSKCNSSKGANSMTKESKRTGKTTLEMLRSGD